MSITTEQRKRIVQKIDDLVIHGASDFYVLALRDGEGEIVDEYLNGHEALDHIDRADAAGDGPLRLEANGYVRGHDDHTMYDGFDCPGCATCAPEDEDAGLVEDPDAYDVLVSYRLRVPNAKTTRHAYDAALAHLSEHARDNVVGARIDPLKLTDDERMVAAAGRLFGTDDVEIVKDD